MIDIGERYYAIIADYEQKHPTKTIRTMSDKEKEIPREFDSKLMAFLPGVR